MDDIQAQIYRRLDEAGIAFERLDHSPVHTIWDCAPIAAALHAMIPKNLFVCTRNLSRVFLCLTHPSAVFRTAEVKLMLGTPRLSFGDAELLNALLKTTPGAVSPLGLLFDDARRVELAIDRRLMDERRLGFHPLTNEVTIGISGADFYGKFLTMVGRPPVWLDL